MKDKHAKIINKIIEFGFACKQCGQNEHILDDLDLISETEEHAEQIFAEIIRSLKEK